MSLHRDSDEDPLFTTARQRQGLRAPEQLPTWQQGLLMFCLLVGFFFAILDTTIVSTSLMTVANQLKDSSNSYWVVLAYLLTYTGLTPIIAKLSDIYGRKSALLGSWLLFAAGSSICGLAKTMAVLIAGRAVQGIGGAGLYSLTTIIMPEIGPQDKPQIIGLCISVTICLAWILGPLLGGFIPGPDGQWWMWIYWMNVPCATIVAAIVTRWYPNSSTSAGPFLSTLARIDVPGSILLMGATILLVLGLQEGSSDKINFESTEFAIILAVSMSCLLLFFVWEYWLSSIPRRMEPLFPLQLIQDRGYLACLITTFLVGATFIPLIIELPLRFIIVNGEPIQSAGLHLMYMLMGTGIGCFIAGIINRKQNLTSQIMVASCALMLTGISLLTQLTDKSTPLPPHYAYQAIFGLGVGLFLTSATMMTTARSTPAHHAAAQGAVSQARVLGGAVGLAVCAIITSAYTKEKLAHATKAQMELYHESLLDFISKNPSINLQEAFAAAFVGMTRIMAGLASLAFAASLLSLRWGKRGVIGGGGSSSSLRGLVGNAKEMSSSRGGSEVELEDLERRQPGWRSKVPPRPELLGHFVVEHVERGRAPVGARVNRQRRMSPRPQGPYRGFADRRRFGSGVERYSTFEQYWAARDARDGPPPRPATPEPIVPRDRIVMGKPF